MDVKHIYITRFSLGWMVKVFTLCHFNDFLKTRDFCIKKLVENGSIISWHCLFKGKS